MSEIKWIFNFCNWGIILSIQMLVLKRVSLISRSIYIEVIVGMASEMQVGIFSLSMYLCLKLLSEFIINFIYVINKKVCKRFIIYRAFSCFLIV